LFVLLNIFIIIAAIEMFQFVKCKSMKKLYSLICLLIIAQVGFAQKFHFGLKASPGLYWIATDASYTEPNGGNMGFNYGAIAEFGFTDNYAFATGMDVSNKAGSYTYKTKTFSSNIDLNLQYLEVPLTIKMKTNEVGYFKYYGQFGLTVGFNLSGSYTGDVKTLTSAGKDTTYIISKTQFGSDSKSIDASLFRAGLLIGAGLEYNLAGSTSLLAGISWDNAFLDALETKNNTPKIKLKGLLLNVGILF